VILALLQQPSFSRGPLALVNTENTPSLDPHRLQKLLVAYYRVLISNRDLPGQLSWPTTPLETLFRAPHPDPGVIFLAIRCYGLQTGMLEADRNCLETELVGDVADMEIPIIFSEHPTESSTFVEACLFAFTERERINEARELLLQGMNDYYTYEDGVATDNISEVDLR
jgi:midasin